ncbi:MAG: cytochrome c3 family protein, partial [bacterium]|nr:cytochrome c3 family protein [bacterium]
MAQLFQPRANLIAKAVLVGFVSFFLGAWVMLDGVQRSPYVTRVGVPVAQPVPFSHKLHVGGLGIDCRHCHSSVEVSAFAGMPPVKTCMNCHSQIFPEAPLLEPVRASYRDNLPLKWNRVVDLPDFVRFDHSIHVYKGVACVTCHGRVDQMPLLWNEQSFQMEWCMDCHRYPERYVRPRERVFDMEWEPPGGGGERLVKEYEIRQAL